MTGLLLTHKGLTKLAASLTAVSKANLLYAYPTLVGGTATKIGEGQMRL